MSLSYYPYRFVKKIDEPWDGPQGFLLYILLYSFKSNKSDKKYNILTGLNEPRECIQTCMAIMKEVAGKDDKASFGFIGANSIGESELETKRFRVYSRYMQTYFNSEEFEHHYNLMKSAYLIICKQQLKDNSNLINDIVEGFKELYPYFD